MWRRPSRRDEDLKEEIRSHLELAEQDLRDRGASAEDARARARSEFGNVAHVEEAARSVWGGFWLDAVRQDIKYALRGFRRSPAFTTVVVLILGSAIALNTSLFTAFNTFFLAEWPIRDPSRVVQFRSSDAIGFSGYERLAAETRTFSGLTATACENCRAWVGDRDVRFDTVSANYFDVLGVPMAQGRGFGGVNTRVETLVAVLSHRFWRNNFAADPQVIGSRFLVNQVSVLVAGVAAREFTGTTIDSGPEFWVPISPTSLLGAPAPTDVLQNVRVIGRLADKTTRDAARAEMNLLLSRESETPQSAVKIALWQAKYVPLAKAQEIASLGLLTIGVLLVLLLACANVGNLLLARSASRTGEIATRLSLGASRSRLLRQFLTENLILAVGACALGLLLSFAIPKMTMDAIAAASERPLDLAVRLTPDLTVMAFASVLAILSVVAFGLAPALLASRQDAASAMKAQSGTLSARLGPKRALLALQVAVSTVLLVSAGLMGRTVQRATQVDLGFDLEGVAEGRVRLPASYTEANRLALTEEFFAATQSLDPTAVAAWAQAFGYAAGATLSAPDAPEAAPIQAPRYSVTSTFFSVMRVPLVAGRTFDQSVPDGIVLSETLAGRLFPGRNPLGRVVTLSATPRRVVGVAADADLMGVSFRREFSRRAAVYEPLVTFSLAARVLVRREKPGQAEALASVAGRLDPRAVLELKPFTALRDARLGDTRIAASIAGLIGTAALVVASVGIAGIFGYVARQRRREIGIRIALGATRRNVLSGVFGSTIRALVVGVATGFLAVALGAPLLTEYVHPDVGAVDLATYAMVGLILTASAIIATIIPVGLASRVNPVTALRSE